MHTSVGHKWIYLDIMGWRSVLSTHVDDMIGPAAGRRDCIGPEVYLLFWPANDVLRDVVRA